MHFGKKCTYIIMRVKIHTEGRNILIVLMLVFLLINVPLWVWVRPLAFAIASTSVCGMLYMVCVNFFRSPKRIFTHERSNAVVSSADGKVVVVEEVFEPEYLKRRCIQVSVFMSLVNVHANWFPVDGTVKYTKHHSGRFMAAYLPKSSTENERSTIVIETLCGQKILVRQIAGAMARRIVTYAEPGIESNINDHMGFIKFGSRIDIYLPLGTEIFVTPGDKTIGGISLIGRLRPDRNPEHYK